MKKQSLSFMSCSRQINLHFHFVMIYRPLCSSWEASSELPARVAKELTFLRKNSISCSICDPILPLKRSAAPLSVSLDNDLHGNIFIEWSENRNERQFVKQKCEHAPNIIHQKFTIRANNERDGGECAPLCEQMIHNRRQRITGRLWLNCSHGSSFVDLRIPIAEKLFPIKSV